MIAHASQFAGSQNEPTPVPVPEVADEVTRYRPQPGPQSLMAQSNADIGIFGGAAGGGKTYYLLLEAARSVGIEGYHGVLFRRTMEQVTNAGGLWDESQDIYRAISGEARQQRYDWRWPQYGSSIRFEQLQYEKTKYEYQGAQIAFIGFDELTHFTEGQFWYLIGRNRSTCGVRPYVRATCNPDSGSWVAQLLEWWIDQGTGLPIPERAGVVRWMVREDEQIEWADSREELTKRYPNNRPKSVTFVPSTLDDNVILNRADPGYRANLMALPRVERERLLGGNWKVSESSQINVDDLTEYHMSGDQYVLEVAGKKFVITPAQCRRFATIDTAGTSREKAEEQKGRKPSYSVCGIWDYYHAADLLLLRHVWRGRVGWMELKASVLATLNEYRVPRAYIENAHHGQALAAEIQGIATELIPTVIQGMAESHRGAKLERAIASGLLSRIEDHRLCVPRAGGRWATDYRAELGSWQGLPDETADQIDISSHAAWAVKKTSSNWGGIIPGRRLARSV